MPMNLAKPTFLTGPNDSLAAVDVYTQKSNTVINNLPDALATANFGAATSIFGSKSMLGSLPLGGAGALISSSLSSITSRLGITNPNLAKAVNSLLPSAVKAIESKLPAASINNMIATAGNVQRVVNMVQTGNITGVLGAVNSIAKTAGIPGINLTDPKGMSTLSVGLITQGIQSNLPGVLTTLKTGGIIPNTASMNSVVKGILPAITQKGDLGALKEITTVAPDSVPVIGTGVLNDFCKYYPDPESPKSISQYQSDFGDVKSTFGAVNPSWLSTSVGGSAATDLSCMVAASPEMKKTMSLGALASTDPEDKWLLAATAPSQEEIAAQQKIALDGITITAGPTTFTPWTEQQQIDAWAAYQARQAAGLPGIQSDPKVVVSTLYPAAASMNNVSAVPVDPRSIQEVVSANKAQSGQATPTSSSRPLSAIQADMDTVMAAWTADLNTRYQPALDQLNRMKTDGVSTAQQIAEQETAASMLKAAVDMLWRVKYDKLSAEYKAAQAILDQITIT